MKFNGRNIFVSPKARLGINVKIGDNSTIYDNVEIGDNTIVCNDSVIGEPLNDYYHGAKYENPPTVIGPHSLVRSHSIIYAGCTIGEGFSTGHHVTIRESTVIGRNCQIGTLSDIQGRVRMGDHCKLHSNVHISQTCSLGECVFLFPFVVMANDPIPPSNDVKGGYIGNFTVVGVHAVILPGVRVGQNCLIGANSVVRRPVSDFSMATGDPAKVVDIREYVVMGKGRPYPWMTRFERGMPWEGAGFDQWVRQQSKDLQPQC